MGFGADQLSYLILGSMVQKHLSMEKKEKRDICNVRMSHVTFTTPRDRKISANVAREKRKRKEEGKGKGEGAKRKGKKKNCKD